MDLKKKNDERVALIVKMRQLLDTAEADHGRDLTADEQGQYAKMEKDVGVLDAIVNRHRTVVALETQAREQRDSTYQAGFERDGGKAKLPKRKCDQQAYVDALFGPYARQGLNGILPEVRAALQEGAGTEGGFLVPMEFETALIAALVDLDPIRANAHVITTASDRNIPIEVSKGSFGYVGEEGTYGQSDPSFGNVILGAFKSGGIIKVSDELLQDAFFALSPYLVGLAADRYNSLETTSFAVGNGVNKPLGLMATTEVAGVTISSVTGTASGALVPDNFVDTFHKLGQRYRRNASWLMHDDTVKLTRKIKTGISGDLTYIWQPGLTADRPDTILGRPVLVDNGVTAAAASAKSIGFVDLSKYYIVDRLGTTLKRLEELYAETGQIGFRFTRRNDARLVDPSAFVYFQHGA